MQDLRIIFMGTPEFAVPSLEILLKNDYNVVAVVTAPDKPAGRGLKARPSAVKKKALEYNLPVLQPKNLKDPHFQDELGSYKANLQIVVAFRMLPESVWNMPDIGTFNLHASLLPQYRGAAPINWAIINGEKETGVTTFFLKHNIDTGDIIMQKKIPITSGDNAGTIYEKCMKEGAELVLDTVRSIENENYTLSTQNEQQELKHAPKIFKETTEIDLNRTAQEVHNFIRGLSPYPGAWTRLNGKLIKIFKSDLLEDEQVNKSENPYITDNKTYLHLITAKGKVAVEELQAEGKKRMSTSDFLRGNTL